MRGVLLPFFNVLGPLAIWLWKLKESQFIDIHGKTALNFQLTLFLLLVGTGVVAVIARGTTLFVVPFLCFAFLYMLAMIAVGAIKSHRGQYLEIPLSAEIIKYA